MKVPQLQLLPMKQERLEVLVAAPCGILLEALVDRVQPIKDLLEALRILMLLEVVAVLEQLAQPVLLE